MPSATRSAAESPVTSLPSNTMRPRVGAKKPLIMLKNVVLPAPFGPMIARSSPSATLSDTWSTATRLPKFLVTFSTWSSVTLPPVLDEAEQTPWEEQHHQDEQHADERHPVGGDARQVVLQDDKDRGPEERSPEGPNTPQHRHDHDISGHHVVEVARVGEIVEQRVERAGKAHEKAGQRERRPDVAFDRDAEKARPPLVLADRQQ